MESQDSRDEYLKKYFADLNVWYNDKYVKPFTHKSYIICFLVYSIVLCIAMGINIYKLFPLGHSIRYLIQLDNYRNNKKIYLVKPKNRHEDYLTFFSKYLVKNYVEQREIYDYIKLKEQILFVKSKSTPQVFNQFYSYLQVDNPNSPILRYEDQVKRFVYPLSNDMLDRNTAKMKFRSIVYDSKSNLIENLIWEAQVGFEINTNYFDNETKPTLYFVVTDYKLKLLENKLESDEKKT
ncbi:Type IV secretion system protein VirB8 [Candidatus Phycorickettsia trachydisci]|uniref:Type IV secretion system protein VirB8 n=1 Tax=Candidatus Phycorickettsia trachydisci TaxID=2115978 RepID=A0A2P1P7W1_9RICK|nr:VirB8/TrbF family protein [Candidatus Phycorickettsia trachydisci]AVP87325.1 Type IV secretion system protein VirB8 [Candidatus Phycorickettsia trachydisci]